MAFQVWPDCQWYLAIYQHSQTLRTYFPCEGWIFETTIFLRFLIFLILGWRIYALPGIRFCVITGCAGGGCGRGLSHCRQVLMTSRVNIRREWEDKPSWMCPLSTWNAIKVSDVWQMTSSYGNVFYITDPMWGESNGHWWIPILNCPVTWSLMYLGDDEWGLRGHCLWSPRRLRANVEPFALSQSILHNEHHKQPGYHSHYETKLTISQYFQLNSCCIALTEPSLWLRHDLLVCWSCHPIPRCSLLKLPKLRKITAIARMTFRGKNWRAVFDVCILSLCLPFCWFEFDPNDLLWMMLGLEFQHRCVCGTSLLQTVTSQWSNRQAISNDVCVNNALFQGRRNNQAARKHCTCTCRSHRQQVVMILTDIL